MEIDELVRAPAYTSRKRYTRTKLTMGAGTVEDSPWDGGLILI